MRSRPSLPCWFINTGGNTLHLHGKLRLIAYVLVFLHASFAVLFLNAGFAHAQNTSQVSESSQKQEKPQISLTPAERAWLAQNHTVRVRAADYEPYLIIREGEPKGISIDFIRLISERAGINIEIIKETRSFGEAFESFKELNGPDWLPHLTPTIEREPYANWSSKSYTSSPRVIFTKKNREFLLDTDNLASKTIAGSRGNIVVKMLKDKYPHIRFTLFDNVGDAMEAVAVGEADAIVTSLTFGTYLIHKRGLSNLKVAGPSPLGNMNFRFAIRKDWPELPGIIDKALDTISAQERSAIENRYLSPVKYEYGITPAGVLKRILSVVGAASGILLLFVFWNRLLKKQVSERTSELTAVNKSLEDEIGERRNSEENLQKSEERYRTLQENVPVGVFRTSYSGKFISVNPAAFNMFGLDAEEDLSSYQVSVFYNEPEKRRDLLSQLKTEGKITDFEAEFRRKDGSLFWGSLSATQVTDKDGNFIFIDGVVQDITERKASEAESQRLQAELAHVDRLVTMDTLATAIIHEINQPLAANRSYAQAALRFLDADQPDIDTVRKALQGVIEDNKRATTVINRLRALVKKEQPHRKAFDLNTIARETLSILSSEMVLRNAWATKDLSSEIPILNGDSVQIQQVVLNLLTNALDAIDKQPAGGRNIHISTKPEGAGWVKLSVSDSGSGIDPDKLEAVFVAFYTTKPLGLGLGLAICWSIVEAHGGELKGENRPDGGATFSFTLPIHSK